MLVCAAAQLLYSLCESPAACRQLAVGSLSAAAASHARSWGGCKSCWVILLRESMRPWCTWYMPVALIRVLSSCSLDSCSEGLVLQPLTPSHT